MFNKTQSGPCLAGEILQQCPYFCEVVMVMCVCVRQKRPHKEVESSTFLHWWINYCPVSTVITVTASEYLKFQALNIFWNSNCCNSFRFKFCSPLLLVFCRVPWHYTIMYRRTCVLIICNVGDKFVLFFTLLINSFMFTDTISVYASYWKRRVIFLMGEK